MTATEYLAKNRQREGELRNDPHLRAQCERLMEPLRLVEGTRDCRTLDEIINEVVFSIMALEANPDKDHTFGYIQVQRGPIDGWSLYIRATDIYFSHMGDYGRRVRGDL